MSPSHPQSPDTVSTNLVINGGAQAHLPGVYQHHHHHSPSNTIITEDEVDDLHLIRPVVEDGQQFSLENWHLTDPRLGGPRADQGGPNRRLISDSVNCLHIVDGSSTRWAIGHFSVAILPF